MAKYLLLVLFLTTGKYTAFAQTSYTSLKFFGLSIHPYGDKNAHLMPINPDKKGYVVWNLGGVLAHERQVANSKYSLKVLQALYSDCAAQAGGFSHVGIRAIILHKNRHQLTGGLGPTLIFRRNWHRLPNYEPSSFFNGNKEDPWQYKILWYGGELEYHYSISEKYAFSLTFIPGWPNIMSLSAGIRYQH